VPQPESQQHREDRAVNQRLTQVGFHQPQKMHDAAHADEINQLDKSWKESDMGVVAFVQDRNNGEVPQALSVPLYR
jgi:hypothetical protein